MPLKKLLILCDPFAPPLYSPRIMSLCRNIRQYGWEAVIVTEKLSYVDFSTDICRMVQIPYMKASGRAARLEYAAKTLANTLFAAKDRWFARQVECHVDVKGFDLIFCSTCMTFPLGAAQLLSGKYRIPLVADLRDIIEQYGTTGYMAHRLPHMCGLGEAIARIYERINIRRRDSVLRRASALVSISPWHRDFLSRINPNTHLIYNGYDESLYTPLDIVSDRFEIVYTGRIMDIGFRDPSMLFFALRSLIDEGSLNPSRLLVSWYIEDKMHGEIARMASASSLEGCVQIKGFVSRDEVPDILHRASVVLLLAGKAAGHGPHGIMTTKFFEALGTEKPILCVRNDGESLAAVMREANAGMSAENIGDVRRFILDKYAEWQSRGFTRQPVVQSVKARFSRQYQARQFAGLFGSSVANIS